MCAAGVHGLRYFRVLEVSPHHVLFFSIPRILDFCILSLEAYVGLVHKRTANSEREYISSIHKLPPVDAVAVLCAMLEAVVHRAFLGHRDRNVSWCNFGEIQIFYL